MVAGPEDQESPEDREPRDKLPGDDLLDEREPPEEHILATAEPFHPAREDGEADAPPPLEPPARLYDAPADDEDGTDDEPAAAAEEAAPAGFPPGFPGDPPPQPPEPPPALEPLPARPRSSLGVWARRAAVLLFVVLIAGPIAMTLVYRFVPVPLTSLMVIRLFQGHGIDHRWRPLSKISPALARAVVAAEDARFCSHKGFDFEAMQKAMANNEKRPNRIKGGSTISQQTAKNVFLWPSRSYVRKGFEAWFTVLIETIWGKRRIMEVYLNSIEWGPGVYGAEAASRRVFGIGADKLNTAQAARLAAILPRPLKWNAAEPGRYVAKRSRRIGAASGTVRRDGLADCVTR